MRCDCGHEFEPVVEYRHLLVCGDCTDAAVVARVMGGGVDCHLVEAGST